MTLQDFILSHYEEGSAREQERPLIDGFFYWLGMYRRCEKSLTANDSQRPDYIYAERMSGYYARFVIQCEREYIAMKVSEALL